MKFIIAVMLILLAVIAFKVENLPTSVEQKVKGDLLLGLDAFYNSVNLLEINSVQAILSPEQSNRLQSLFLETRTAYKRIEYLVEYLDPEFIENLNGADLIKGDPNIFSTDEINPKGLQVIENLVYGSLSDTEIKNIANLCQQLESDIIHLKKNIENIEINSTMIFDASRSQIIRICFLGITGFDSPTAKNSLPECEVAIKAVHQTMESYLKLCSNPSLKIKINQSFNNAILFLQSNQDFNTFDRLEFIKEFGNTLYSLILDLQQTLEIPFPEEMSNQSLPVNYEVRNLFDENLLNPYYYNPAQKDNKEINKIELGKLLFFDPILSFNNKRACASCHKPNKAFTDGNIKSIAFDLNGTVVRNAPTLINAIFQGDYFYDLRTEFVETQIDHVIFNKDEFNSNYELIVQKINQSSEYKHLFSEAFPDQPGDAMNGYTITKSIADYVRSLVTMDSEFDLYMRNETNSISPEIKNGFNLFMGKAKCGTCHFAPTFYGTIPPLYIESETEVIGVPFLNDTVNGIIDHDLGRYKIQQAAIYKFSFKTATVRNIELTSPYMHNGVFNTLEEVLRFYNHGGGAGIKINLENQTLDPEKLNLSQSETKDIIAFMKALTDTSGVISSPQKLPLIEGNLELNNRKIGGEY